MKKLIVLVLLCVSLLPIRERPKAQCGPPGFFVRANTPACVV